MMIQKRTPAAGKQLIGVIASAFALLIAPTSMIAQDTPVSADPPLDTGYVIYDRGPITLPLGIGLRIPGYNRVDGLAVGWGPDIKLSRDRIKLSPTVTYRTHIGAIDPEITGRISFGPADELRFTGGRSTFTNDGWIRSDILNSLAALALGTDVRNYFRADRGTAEFFHTIVEPTMRITPSIGVLHEYAWSTGVPVRHSSAPWSALGRTDTLKIRRINPAIVRGHTTSGLGGIRIDFDDNMTKARLTTRVEHAFDSPVLPAADGDGFTQFTADAKAKFPTFGTQSFTFGGHAVFTSGDAPPQRFAYLGGSSTLSTVEILAYGGDRLLFVEGEYAYPLRAPVLQFVGAPVLTLRYAAGSAGVGELPEFVQNIGIGVSLKVIKAEYQIDPSYKESPYRKKNAVSVSLSLPF